MYGGGLIAQGFVDLEAMKNSVSPMYTTGQPPIFFYKKCQIRILHVMAVTYSYFFVVELELPIPWVPGVDGYPLLHKPAVTKGHLLELFAPLLRFSCDFIGVQSRYTRCQISTRCANTQRAKTSRWTFFIYRHSSGGWKFRSLTAQFCCASNREFCNFVFFLYPDNCMSIFNALEKQTPLSST